MEYSSEVFEKAAHLAKHRGSVAAPREVVASLAALMHPDQVKVSFAQMGQREGGGTDWFVLWASEDRLVIGEACSANSNDWDESESGHVKPTTLKARIVPMTELLEITVTSVNVAWVKTSWQSRATYEIALKDGTTYSLPRLTQAGAERDEIQSVVEHLLRHLT